MSLETDLTAALQALCSRVSPDVAPLGTARPYVTYQAIGGRPLRWLDGTAADKRHTMMQVNVWAETRAAALALIRQIETALCASTAFKAWPISEPRNTADQQPDQTWLYGCLQEFHIYSLR